MRTTLAGIVCGLCVVALATLSAAEPPKAAQNFNDANLHLLVDDAEIAATTNLLRVLNRPRKHPQPVLVADQPWEGDRAQAWGSVIQEPDGRVRLWYFAFNTERSPNELDRGGYAYAESRDGIHWTKPSLGVVEFRGSKSNNLFYTFAPDGKNLVDEELARRGLGLPALDEDGNQIGLLNNADGLTVVRDDGEPDPQRRYKLIANMQDHRMWAPYYRERYPNVTDAQVKQAQAVFGQYMDTSPDGIQWARRPRRLLRARGDYMMVTRDYRNRQWWLNERAKGRTARNAALRTSQDLFRWSEPQLIFDNPPESGGGQLFEWHGGITPFNYGNVNLGFLEKWSLAGFGNTCELVCQRDGHPWQRVAPGQPFLDVGPEGGFDRTLIYPTHNPPVRLNDQLYIFYTGAGANESAVRGLPMAIGVVTIGLDRFAGLAHFRGGKPGVLVTKPIAVSGTHLEVNVEPLDKAMIRVALSDGEKTFPGYDFESCELPVSSKPVYAPVRWKNKPDLTDLRGQSASLHFEIKGAVLYSFRFKE